MPNRSILALLPLIALTACDDGPTGPRFPDVRGIYAASWTYQFDAGSFGTFSFQCTGTFTLTEQDGENFTGSFVTDGQGDDCESSSGSIEGEVGADGGINFFIDTFGTDDEISALTGCNVVAADNQLSGTFLNNTLAASADATLDCPTQASVLRVTLELELIATKN